MSDAHFSKHKLKQFNINIFHIQEDGGSEKERVVFGLDTYFHLEIAGSLVTKGKHLIVMLGDGPS